MKLDDVWQEDLSFKVLVPFFRERWVDSGFVLFSLRVFRLASVHEKKKNRHWMLEIFLVCCRKNLGLHRYFFPLLYDWSCKLAPPSRPIRDRSKTNQDVVTRVFPRFTFTFYDYIYPAGPASLIATDSHLHINE